MPDFLWHLLNGALLLSYLLAARLPAVAAFAALLLLARGGPVHVQPWLYGGALGYTIYTGYLQHLQARDWSLFPQGGDHLSLLAQGQGYVQLIGAISLLVVMPLGLVALLLQGLLVHQSVRRTYADTVSVVTSQAPRRR